MALFDKLGELAKNVGDKTNEMLEAGRLSSKAKSEENAVAELKSELGQYFYERYLNGDPMDETALEHCRNIQAGEENIAALYAEIQKLKAEPSRPAGPLACPNCGAEVKEGAKFCPSCGAKIMPQPKMFCPECGAEITPETRFCSACGTKVRED